MCQELTALEPHTLDIDQHNDPRQAAMNLSNQSTHVWWCGLLEADVISLFKVELGFLQSIQKTRRKEHADSNISSVTFCLTDKTTIASG